LGCEILKTYASYEKDGLIPNFVSVSGKDIAFNSVDASLWFCWAVQDYLKTTNDLASVKKDFFPVIKKILTQFATNRVAHVALHENGLIWVGNAMTQLTWMDAKVQGQPVTPRHGYAVELNALWFNALSFFKELCTQCKVSWDPLLEKAREAFAKNFAEIFWCHDQACLADVVNERGQDKSIRPNQIFAASLPYSPLDLTQKRKVVGCVEKNLLTSCGLRTLTPRHEKYKPEYHGSPGERDGAYHQGTVWPWLIGHFTEASLQCSKDLKTTRTQLVDGYKQFLQHHLKTACVGGVSEIFNGDPPHTAKGCIHQAWSVAEIIRGWRLLTKSVFGAGRPSYLKKSRSGILPRTKIQKPNRRAK
jgi:predicted glycogen debranching enzyme